MKTTQKTNTLKKKKSNTKFLMLLFIFSTLFTYAQTKCDATLDVFKDRNSRSTTHNGTYYKMVLTNKTNSNELFDLTATNNNANCNNSDGSSNKNNTQLLINFENLDLKEIRSISVPAKGTIEFYAHVNVPITTVVNKWCCTKIVAQSKTCASFSVSTELNTLVIDSIE